MQDQNVCPQNPTFAFDDRLFCDEEETDLDFGCGFGFLDQETQILKQTDHLYTHFEHDLLWAEDELSSLLSKQNSFSDGDLTSNEFLMVLRKESVDWMTRVSTHYGFVAMTTILAVNYFDRFLWSPSFQRDKPWMNQLAAVACLSLASKVEEIQAPLLMDLQVEGAKFVFESKTIMKMELLVLSSLQWKMNPVTPLSFFDYIMRRLGLVTHHHHSELVRRCERIILAVINDSRSLGYLPSVIAAATMFTVIKEVDPHNAFDYLNQIKEFLEINEKSLDECCKLMMEASDNPGSSSYMRSHKRRYEFSPGSPNGVIDSYFSGDSSSDSWAVASSVSSSPEAAPLLKKMRAQEQVMKVVPPTRVPVSNGY